MILGTLFRYGLPFSFVYCTIYQQNIWREGDERLVEEQKRTWRKFFTTIDDGYRSIAEKLNLSPEISSKKGTQAKLGLVAQFDSLDMRECWNSKVHAAFVSADRVISNPNIIACKAYRKIQPYISTPENKTEAKTDNH